MKKLYFLCLIGCFLSLAVAGQTSYQEDFNTLTTTSSIVGDASYKVTLENQKLKVHVTKSDNWSGLRFNFPSNINLTDPAHRVISFDIATDTTFTPNAYPIFVQIFNASNSVVAGAVMERIIKSTGTFQTVTFDMTETVSGFNYASVNAFQIVIHPKNQFQGYITLDNIKVGSVASFAPFFTWAANPVTYINTKHQPIKLLNAIDAIGRDSNISFTGVSSNQSLLPNANISFSPSSTFLSNSLYAHTRPMGGTTNLPTGRPVLMNYTTVGNQFGTVLVTVTATALGESYTTVPFRQIIHITVNRNVAPFVGEFPTSVQLGSGVVNEIMLNNISNGNGESAQLVTITGTSDNQSFIPNSGIVVSFNGFARTAKVMITPTSFSSLPARNCNIFLTLKDDGGTAAGGTDTRVLTIPAAVFPVLYKKPKFNPIQNVSGAVIGQGPYQITISGVSDGNGGANIASIVAESSFPAGLPNPTVSYTTGQTHAILSYNPLAVGDYTVTVTATNLGAPANSNGNSSFQYIFSIKGINPPINGFVESMTNTSIFGWDYYTSPRLYNGGVDFAINGPSNSNWFVEGQNSVQTMTINTTTGVATLAMNIPNNGTQRWAGVWYTPRSTFDFKSNPYLSIDVWTNGAQSNSIVAIDIFDINGKRYGVGANNPPKSINSTQVNFTYCFNGIPENAGLDFSRIVAILFNFGNGSVGNGYNGTAYIANIRLGNQANNASSCPGNLPTVRMDSLYFRHYTTAEAGAKVITLTGISAGASPITGPNPNPVTLSYTASGPISTFNISPIVNGNATISYTTPATTGTTFVTITGVASGSISASRTLQVIVSGVPSTPVNAIITNDLNANMPDGQKGQTMDGFGVTMNGDVGGDGTGKYELKMPKATEIWSIQDANMTMIRMAIPPDFEYVNDNNDPFVFNWDAYDYKALKADLYKAYRDAGCERFIGTMWTIPVWTKFNKKAQVLSTDYQWIGENTLDTNFTEEVAEFCAAYVLALKNATGIELYALSFANEPQFNQFYASAQINATQFALLTEAVGRRFQQLGIKTFVFGPEILNNPNWEDYFTVMQNSASARQFMGAYAIHNYDSQGVNPGSNGPNIWNNLKNYARNANLTSGRAKYLAHPLTAASSTANGSTNGIPLWQTETSGWQANYNGAFQYASVIYNALVHGNCSAWTFWTLDDNDPVGRYGLLGGSKVKPIYYASKHYSKFITPGARRVPVSLATSTGVFMTAFQNPDASVAMVMINSNSSYSLVSLSGTNLPSAFRAFRTYEGEYFTELNTVSSTVIMPPRSIVTLYGGANTFVAVTSVSVTTSGAAVINSPGGTLQAFATVLPTNAGDPSVTWSVIPGTGSATINATGMLTAQTNGTVTVRATSVSNPSVFGNMVVSITGQFVAVTSVGVSLQSGLPVISVNNDTRQMVATVLPVSATNQNIIWSVAPAFATISGTGLLGAINNGIVTVTGRSQSNNTVAGMFVLTITNQATATISVTSINVSGLGGNLISVDKLSKIISATVLPANATNPAITWSANNPTVGILTSTGVPNTIQLNPLSNGLITVTATSVAYPGVSGSVVITVTGQVTPATGIVISVVGNIQQLNVDDQTVTLAGAIFPEEATFKIINWLSSNTDIADILDGVLTAKRNGIVTVTGASAVQPDIKQFLVLTITNQVLQGIMVITGPTEITQPAQVETYRGLIPLTYPDRTVKFSIKPQGLATISGSGSFKALYNGVVTITANALIDSLIMSSVVVTISGQDPTGLVLEIFTSDFEPISGNDIQIVGPNSQEFYLAGLVTPEVIQNKVVRFTISDMSVVDTTSANLPGNYLLKLTTKKPVGLVTITGKTTNDIESSLVLRVVEPSAALEVNSIEVQAYPNPSTGTVYVSLPENMSNARVKLQDIAGREVPCTVKNLGKMLKIELNDYKGLAVLQLAAQERLKTLKIFFE